MGYSKSHGCAYCDFWFYSVISIWEIRLKRAQMLLDVVTSYFREFVFHQDTLDDGVQNVFDNNDEKNWTVRKPRRLLERSWTVRKNLGKIQILRAQKLLANHQHLPWFIINLPVHLKTNQMVFWAVEALRLQTWTSVLHQRNEEWISVKKTKSNLFPCWFYLSCVRVTFFSEPEFINFNYFIIEFSDHSACSSIEL